MFLENWKRSWFNKTDKNAAETEFRIPLLEAEEIDVKTKFGFKDKNRCLDFTLSNFKYKRLNGWNFRLFLRRKTFFCCIFICLIRLKFLFSDSSYIFYFTSYNIKLGDENIKALTTFLRLLKSIQVKKCMC